MPAHKQPVARCLSKLIQMSLSPGFISRHWFFGLPHFKWSTHRFQVGGGLSGILAEILAYQLFFCSFVSNVSFFHTSLPPLSLLQIVLILSLMMMTVQKKMVSPFPFSRIGANSLSLSLVNCTGEGLLNLWGFCESPLQSLPLIPMELF